MKKLLFVLLLFIAFISCRKNPEDKLSVNGTWIETTRGMDTLTFLPLGTGQILNLNREREFANGYLRPKSGSGPYQFTIDQDTIALHWMPASSLYTPHFYFNIDPETNLLSIGNFYDQSKVRGETLTFTKMP